MKTQIIFFTALLLMFGLKSQVLGQEQTVRAVVHFDFNSSVITKEYSNTLNALIDELQKIGRYEIKLLGHTDQIGSDDFNQKLSEERVNAVQNFFIAHGISGDKIITSAYGKKQLLTTTMDENERFKNRRVEIVVTIFSEQPIISETPHDDSKIEELFKIIQKKPEEFCIDPTR